MPRIPGNYLGSDRVSGCGPSCKGLTCTSRWAHPDPEQRSVINGHYCGCKGAQFGLLVPVARRLLRSLQDKPKHDQRLFYRLQNTGKHALGIYRTQVPLLSTLQDRHLLSLQWGTGTCSQRTAAQTHLLSRLQNIGTLRTANYRRHLHVMSQGNYRKHRAQQYRFGLNHRHLAFS